MKKLLLLLFTTSLIFAQTIENLKDLTQFSFEDAFEKSVSIPENTKRVLITFDKQANAQASEYINNQAKEFLPEHQSVYIGDIHKMPSMITYMFARPKMQKYNFTIFLYNKEGLDKIIPYQKDKITALEFDENQKLINILFLDNLENYF